MSAPTIWSFEGVSVRAMPDAAGETWFVLHDVCQVLKLKNPSQAADDHLDPTERNTLRLTEGIRSGPGNPNVNVVNLSGAIALTLASRKPKARAFRRWLTGEVVPSIMRTGRYEAPGTDVLPSQDTLPLPGPAALRTQLKLVAEYRATFGAAGAQWLVERLGLPMPPAERLAPVDALPALTAALCAFAAAPPPSPFACDAAGVWTGPCWQLLPRLARIAGPAARAADWPRSPIMLGTQLRRIAPGLPARGLSLRFGRTADRKNRFVEIHRVAIAAPPAPPATVILGDAE